MTAGMAGPVRVNDTLTGGLRELEPREDRRIGIYACGPTVYAPIHVGNARPYVVFSLFKRFLERIGCDVTLVVNDPLPTLNLVWESTPA